MNVLQLTSDWKWTGPAEPMLLLHRALASLGERMFLACPAPPPEMAEGLLPSARTRGIEVDLQISRGRGARWRRDASDVARVRQLLEEQNIQVVHTWHTRDHLIAYRAAARRRRSGKTILVRTHKSADAIARTPWNRWLFGRATDALLCVSPKSAEANAAIRSGRPVLGALGVVDVDSFRSAESATAEFRAKLGLRPGAPVIGVVARVQPHRRFDLLWAAMQKLALTHPQAQLLIVGRGTHIEEVARRPVRELGLEDRVIFAGHVGAAYPQVLRAIDILTFLVPGSDGSCRAVLEAAACGIPAVATRAGALPEIVIDGESGCLVDDRPEALALSWGRLLDDESERHRLGAGAQGRAQKLFVPERLASEVRALYARALSG